MEEIGNIIYQRRTELGLTLEDVGNAVGVGKSTVRKWEKGMIKNMGRDKIAALAKVLNINPALLIRPANMMVSELRTSEEIDQDKDRLEALHQRSGLRMLFDRQLHMSDEDIDLMFKFADRIAKERER